MTTQKLLDPEWIVCITEEIKANPMGIAFAVEPRIMGMYDCAMGLPDEALARGYRTVGDALDYLVGYQQAAATWAATVQEINDTLPVVDYEAELEDLQSGMDDIEFWRTGGA